MNKLLLKLEVDIFRESSMKLFETLKSFLPPVVRQTLITFSAMTCTGALGGGKSEV